MTLVPAMKTRGNRHRAAALVLVTLASSASADTEVLRAWIEAIDKGDATGCADRFADNASFIDLGRDLSDRVDWFCRAVIDAGGYYGVLSTETDGATTIWALHYSAGSYALEGLGTLRADDGRIVELVIERRP